MQPPQQGHAVAGAPLEHPEAAHELAEAVVRLQTSLSDDGLQLDLGDDRQRNVRRVLALVCLDTVGQVRILLLRRGEGG